jgi:hypothetical protein
MVVSYAIAGLACACSAACYAELCMVRELLKNQLIAKNYTFHVRPLAVLLFKFSQLMSHLSRQFLFRNTLSQAVHLHTL